MASASFTKALLDTKVLADVLGAEAALGRIQFVSGTHAIATALYSVLRPGDELLAVAGRWASAYSMGVICNMAACVMRVDCTVGAQMHHGYGMHCIYEIGRAIYRQLQHNKEDL